ncbi:MAG: hypothetical protein H6812_02680 [Phycisphaeraceae bacterium]|nr:hypothetical protein [Phycisphaerales bacterium]MCB9842144.1 hypothetical protein [Phycisphaeraceae bacterium]
MLRSTKGVGGVGGFGAAMMIAMAGLGVGMVGGCASTAPVVEARAKPAPVGVRRPQVYERARRPITEIISAPTLRGRVYPGPRLVSSMTLRAPQAPAAADSSAIGELGGELIEVKLATNGASPADVLRTLLGDFLGRDFVIDPKVMDAKESMTMNIDREMTRREVMDLAYSLTGAFGWIIEDRDGVLFVRPEASMMKVESAPVIRARASMPDGAPVVRVMRLNTLAIKSDDPLYKEMLSSGGKILVSGQTVMIIDRGTNVDRLSRLIEILDRPVFDGAEILSYRLGSVTGAEAAGTLNTITGSTQAGGFAPLVTFVGVGQTPRLLAITRDASLRGQINDLVASVDQPPETSERYHFLYRIQYYDPDALNSLMRSLLLEHIEEGAEQRSPESTKIRITHDATARLMTFRCTMAEYEDILRILQAVDRPPAQVQLDTTIAEVQLTGRLQLGVESFLQGLEIDKLGTIELSATPGLPATPSVSAFLVGSDGFMVFQALENEGSAKILQRPNITAMDGAEAEFQVGGETPIVKADIDTTVQNQGSTGIRREIEYRDTGVILKAQPRILESGTVVLTIDLEINDVGAQTDLGPEFTTRSYKSTVIVPHGMTLILAGVINDETRRARTQVPGLGSVPVIGDAFASQDNRDERTELFMAITPTIVTDPMVHSIATSEFLEATSGIGIMLAEHMNDLPRGAGLVIPDEWGETPVAPEEIVPEPMPEMPEGFNEMFEQMRNLEKPV